MRKGPAFSHDHSQACILQRGEEAHLRLELHVQTFLIAGLHVALRQVKCRARHRQHDQHQGDEKLYSKSKDAFEFHLAAPYFAGKST